ncbi:NADH:flavin oxidoreductase [Nakamurella sp. YIM 132087]|uniref:NADH:flavin oxidoreductase n=1 Tax=Nakamurella alba TaxID=2665158 RepID=A0A7K1FFY0_9ACTN|nr:NADH:flavin oxidoreductase [Nakamurella alba]MTD12379.1 NADH:flavin oxidoreductase [Nakamurella alba]
MTSPAEALTFPRGPSWDNRLALAPLTNTQSHPDGSLSDDEYEWLVARARGGFGMARTCAAFISPSGQAWAGQLGVAGDRHLPGLRRLADGLSAAGARSVVQLHHGGIRADPALTGLPLVGPWVKPGSAMTAMSTDDITRAVADFASAARLAEQAGFDGVEVHGAHGYLLGQFLDARRNHRDDGYGGSFENRMRVYVEVLEEIRRVTVPEFQVGLRISPEGYGVTLDEGRELARLMLASGLLDYLDVSLWDVFAGSRFGDHGLLIDHFVDLPRHGTRLGVAGKVLSRADVDWCLDRSVDFVGVGFGGVLHHDFARKVLQDNDFVPLSPPVAADHLRGEFLSPVFVDYIDQNWPDFVAKG